MSVVKKRGGAYLERVRERHLKTPNVNSVFSAWPFSLESNGTRETAEH